MASPINHGPLRAHAHGAGSDRLACDLAGTPIDATDVPGLWFSAQHGPSVAHTRHADSVQDWKESRFTVVQAPDTIGVHPADVMTVSKKHIGQTRAQNAISSARPPTKPQY
jgi:hypothetical protein